MKKANKKLASAIVLGLMLAVPVGASAAEKPYNVDDKGAYVNFVGKEAAGNNTFTITEADLDGYDGKTVGVYGSKNMEQGTEVNITGNNITVSGINSSVLHNVTGAFTAKGDAVKNSITLTDSVLAVTEYESGAYAESYGAQSGAGNVTGNEFILKNVTVKDGEEIGEAKLAGGFTYDGNADGNKLVLNNVQAKATMDFGNNKYNFIAGGFASGTANDNEVVITGDSIITGTVYGGYSVSEAATGNTIIIAGNADVSEADLHGGNNKDEQRAAGADNKLIIGDNWSGAIRSVADFENVTLGAGSSVTTAINDEATTVNMTAGSTWDVKDNSKVNAITGEGTIGLAVSKTDGDKTYTATTVTGNTQGAQLTLTASNYDADTVADLAEATAIFGALKTGMTGGAAAGVTGMEIKETITSGAITADENGGNVHQDQYSTTEANMRDIASVALVAWRQEDSTLSQRLGELRSSEGDQGIWARMSRGEFEYDGAFKNQYNYFQLGYDWAANDWHYGAAISHNDGQTTYANGYGENDSTSLTLYGTWLGNEGKYADIVVKQGKLNNEFTNYAEAGVTTGDYDMWGTSISAEYGQKLEMENDWYITPQAQLTYMRIGGEDYTANVATKGDDGKVTNAPMQVSQDGMDSFVGRIGFEAGKNISEKGSIYAKASLLHEFAGEADTTLLYGDNHGEFSQDLGDTWYECGFGVNYKTSDSSYVYADVVKTFGGDVETPWQWNAGMRFTF